MNELHSLSLERSNLGGLIKFPNIFADIEAFLTEYDFYHPIHATIYCVIRNYLSKGEKLDKVILAQQIKNLNISSVDDIDIFEYINILGASQITEKGVIDASKELVKFRIRREIVQTAEKVKEFIIKEGANKSFDELVNGADAIYNEKISSYNVNTRPIDLFENLESLIIERGNNPISQMGFITPYQNFNKSFGGIRNGNVYAWVSRSGEGKSTILADIGYKMTLLNPGLKTLFLDTENLTEDMQFRQASSMTSIPTWFLETGQYAKNKELYESFINQKSKFESSKGKIYHIQCAGKKIEEVISIIKRWYYKNCGRGNPAVVIYDYIKITGEMEYNKQEYQLIGDKINKLKETAVELNVPILTANQLNRLGAGDLAKDDSSAISQSDRLNWFASFVAIFRRKRLEEISNDGIDFGTHKMVLLKSRHQGQFCSNHADLVKISEGKKHRYVHNFFNFDVKMFNVEEKGTLRDIIKAKKEKIDLSEDGDISIEDENL